MAASSSRRAVGDVPRHARAVEPARETASRVLSVILIAATVLAFSYPRSVGLSLKGWLLWAALGLGASYVLLPPHRRLPVPWPVVAALAVMGASTVWSQDAQGTLHATLLYGAFAAIAWAAAARARIDDVPVGVAVGIALIVTLSVVATALGYDGPKKWTAWFIDGKKVASFQGLYGNRNILAYTLVVTLPGVAALGILRRASLPVAATILSICIPVLIQVRSATGILASAVVLTAAALGHLVWYARSRASVRARRLTTVVGATGLVAVLCVVGPFAVDAIARKTTTLSGRTPLWESILRTSADNLALGNGWGTVWRYHWMPAGKNPVLDAINAPLGTNLAHGHNAPLDVLPQIGLIGIAAFLLLQTWSFVRLIRAQSSPARNWGLLTLLAVNVVGLTEPMWTVPLSWGLLVMVAVVAAQAPRKVRTVRHPGAPRARPDVVMFAAANMTRPGPTSLRKSEPVS